MLPYSSILTIKCIESYHQLRELYSDSHEQNKCEKFVKRNKKKKYSQMNHTRIEEYNEQQNNINHFNVVLENILTWVSNLVGAMLKNSSC